MNKAILVINSGSSSIKFQVLDNQTHEVLASGIAEELKTPQANLTIKANGRKDCRLLKDSSFVGAMTELFRELSDRNLKDIIVAVGHRVVTGIDKFTKPTLLNNEIIDQIEDLKPYAPLHNPAAAEAMRATMSTMPNLPQVAVFDTAFHSTMPERAFRYAVPDEWYKKYGVRRYGFHGSSYQYISRMAAKMIDRPLSDSAFVICHIGSGASLAAVLSGKSVDTTMGFTPLDGIVMCTRAGSVDPSIIPYMMKKLGKSADEIMDYLNHKSGILGLSNLSSDQRQVCAAAQDGNPKAEIAMQSFAYSIAKQIAAMMTALPRVDAIVFTAGAGENAPNLRARIVKHLAIFGYKIDEELNEATLGRLGLDGQISQRDTPKILVIRTNEELVIADEVKKVISN